MMGNPNAKVKLVEIGSLSCPHCKWFEEEGAPILIDKYVKTGQVSWEFRPYIIHGPIDMAANLVARCNGAEDFLPDHAGAVQGSGGAGWARSRRCRRTRWRRCRTCRPTRCSWQMASLMGLQDWAAARGVPQAKSNQCLSDQKMIDNEVQQTSDVNNQFPEFTGTPAFVINGKMLKDTADGKSSSRSWMRR